MTPDPDALSRLLAEARQLLALGQLSAAAGTLQRARALAEASADTALIVDTFGALLARKGDLLPGLQHHLMAARIAREDILNWDGQVSAVASPPDPKEPSKNPQLEASALNHVGALGQLCDQPRIAEAALRRAARLLDDIAETEARPLRAEVLHNLGVFLMNVGAPKEAIPFLERALRIDEQLSEAALGVHGAAAVHSSLLRLAGAHRRAQTPEDHSAGRAHAERSLELAEALGPTARSLSLLELAALAFARGELLDAMTHTRAAIDLLEAVPDHGDGDRRLQLGRAYTDLATYARKLGRRKAALSALDRATEHAQAARSPALAGMIARERALALELTEDA